MCKSVFIFCVLFSCQDMTSFSNKKSFKLLKIYILADHTLLSVWLVNIINIMNTTDGNGINSKILHYSWTVVSFSLGSMLLRSKCMCVYVPCSKWSLKQQHSFYLGFLHLKFVKLLSLSRKHTPVYPTSHIRMKTCNPRHSQNNFGH